MLGDFELWVSSPKVGGLGGRLSSQKSVQKLQEQKTHKKAQSQQPRLCLQLLFEPRIPALKVRGVCQLNLVAELALGIASLN